jgi:hypothetical protein
MVDEGRSSKYSARGGTVDGIKKDGSSRKDGGNNKGGDEKKEGVLQGLNKRANDRGRETVQSKQKQLTATVPMGRERTGTWASFQRDSFLRKWGLKSPASSHGKSSLWFFGSGSFSRPVVRVFASPTPQGPRRFFLLSLAPMACHGCVSRAQSARDMGFHSASIHWSPGCRLTELSVRDQLRRIALLLSALRVR